MATARREQARRTRQQILDAAVQLFARNGYDATSLQMIADQLGLTKAAVYYHFRAKADMLVELSDPAIMALNEALDRVEAGRRADRITLLINGIIDVLLAQREVITVLAGDPALRGKKYRNAERYGAVVERIPRLAYGDDPTPDQRAALYLAAGLGDVVPLLRDLSNDDLRATLIRTCTRLLTVPAR